MKLKYWLLIAAICCGVGAIWVADLLFASILLFLFTGVEWLKSEAKGLFPWEISENNNKNKKDGTTKI